MANRKKAISVRIGEGDLNSLRRLAKRLGARDSDVIRVALKSLLSKLSPLHDHSVRGHSLVPVFLENGTELFRHFDLDTPRLDRIINDGVLDRDRVELEDIQLIAMSGIQRSYLKWRLERVNQVGSASEFKSNAASSDNAQVEQTLRRYLYEKYVNVRNEGQIPEVLGMEEQL